jgi:hypothetical protein
MGTINLINLVDKPIETKNYIHGTSKKRDVLKKVQEGKPTITLLGSHDKLPGGFANYNEHVKIRRKRQPRYNKTKRKKLKSIK